MKLSVSLLALLTSVTLQVATSRANAAPAASPRPPAGTLAPAQSQAVWHTPRPPYPRQARALGEQGNIELKISTDARGRVVKVFLLHAPAETASESIKDITMKWAIYYWSGPPNATKTVILAFRLR